MVLPRSAALCAQSNLSIDRLVIRQVGVCKLLDEINLNKASGPDNILGRVLKELANEIDPVLTSLPALLRHWNTPDYMDPSKYYTHLQKR